METSITNTQNVKTNSFNCKFITYVSIIIRNVVTDFHFCQINIYLHQDQNWFHRSNIKDFFDFQLMFQKSYI